MLTIITFTFDSSPLRSEEESDGVAVSTVDDSDLPARRHRVIAISPLKVTGTLLPAGLLANRNLALDPVDVLLAGSLLLQEMVQHGLPAVEEDSCWGPE